MLYVGIGALGFLTAYLFDLAAMRRVRGGKALVGVPAAGLITYATFAVISSPERLRVPAMLLWTGWVCLLIASALLIYSLFIELPFRRTYLADGVAQGLVQGGTYALVRHPAVAWYGLLLVGLFLVTGSRLMLVAAPVWFTMDVLYVVLQDSLFFPRMFRGYYRYQQQTPMLLPNRRSIAACLRTMRHPARPVT